MSGNQTSAMRTSIPLARHKATLSGEAPESVTR